MLSHSLAYHMAITLTIVAFLAGCTGPAPQSDPSTSAQPTASMEASAAPDTSKEPTPIPGDTPSGDEVSRDDLIHEKLVLWEVFDFKKQEPLGTASEQADPFYGRLWADGYEIVGDKQIRVFFLGGRDGCSGYRTQVEEHPDRIAIAIIEGYIPGKDLDGSCAEAIGFSHSMLIDLKEPVGDRAIVPLARPDSLKP